MNVKQRFSILYFLKNNKSRSDGKSPIYARITIDGLKEEISTGCKANLKHWDKNSKTVTAGDPDFRKVNKKLLQLRVDLERHFDLMQAKHEVATPRLVIGSHRSPLNGARLQQEKIENLELSEQIDQFILHYLQFNNRVQNAGADGKIVHATKARLLSNQREKLHSDLQRLCANVCIVFDQKQRGKTLVLAVDEYLLNFLQLCMVGHRSANSLEKMIGRKRRLIEFLNYRYNAIDQPLDQLEYQFIDQYYTFLLVQKKVVENTAMKYVQGIKEIMDRAVSKGWVGSNPFVQFKCRYTDPKHDWLTMQEFNKLYNHDFSNEKLGMIRDIFLFSSFTGLSYQEVYSLRPGDIINGIDRKKWINKNRQKTGTDETLPILPLPLHLMDKYKDHPVVLRKNKLFPVPTNQEYNRCLKVIAEITGISIVLRTHKARFFFANEVTYNQGVPLKTVSRMLGHKSIKTTEIYVRANKQNISEHMSRVEEQLFDKEGNFASSAKSKNSAKVIELKRV